MKIMEFISPFLKVVIERFAHIEIVDRPNILDSRGALIVCNHVGWADGFWMAYAVYPRNLHFMSKKELFDTRFLKWVLEQAGGIPVDRKRPSPSSVKTAIELLKRGDVLLVYPAGTRTTEEVEFKRGAVTIAIRARAPIIPAVYDGPGVIKPTHLITWPRVRIIFGRPIVVPTTSNGRDAAIETFDQMQTEMRTLRTRLEGLPWPACSLPQSR